MFEGDELLADGEIVVRFKTSILKRTTFTVGDTLDQFGDRHRMRMVPRLFDNP
jgi:hypothetical protein